MTLKTTNAMLGAIPDATALARSQGPGGKGLLHRASIRDLLTRSMNHILGDSNTELATVDPSTPPTITNLYIQIAAGRASVGGVYGRFAAQDDYDLLVESYYALDGTDGGVPSADGKTFILILVACVVDGAVTLVAIQGAEADDAAEVEPNDAQLAAALRAAAAVASSDIELLEPEAGAFQVGIATIQRVAVDTITDTHVVPASDDDLAAYRSHWNIFGEQT